MLSQTAEYALRAVVWLAGNAGAPATTDRIARATKVPADYLSKVMQLLGRGGLVEARRGRHGGFTLLRPAATITALEVVNAVDPVRRIARCPLGRKAHRHELCPLHRRLDSAAALVEEALGAASIAELLDDNAPLCRIGKAAHA
jgi:Rrf2 family transcriptional regulator, nitric oxide-sensitive transcriptional repressor